MIWFLIGLRDTWKPLDVYTEPNNMICCVLYMYPFVLTQCNNTGNCTVEWTKTHFKDDTDDIERLDINIIQLFETELDLSYSDRFDHVLYYDDKKVRDSWIQNPVVVNFNYGHNTSTVSNQIRENTLFNIASVIENKHPCLRRRLTRNVVRSLSYPNKFSYLLQMLVQCKKPLTKENRTSKTSKNTHVRIFMQLVR